MKTRVWNRCWHRIRLVMQNVCIPTSYPRRFSDRVRSPPPYRSHSLGDGLKCHHGRGFKIICIACRCTSAMSYFPILLITQPKNPNDLGQVVTKRTREFKNTHGIDRNGLNKYLIWIFFTLLEAYFSS